MASYLIEKPYNLYKILWLIEKRPGMYIGTNELSDLKQFINAYTFCADMHDIEEEKIFPPFDYFHEFIQKKYNWFESTSGWCNMILKENNDNEEEALKDFFTTIKVFQTLKPISIQKVKLTEENIIHNENKGSRYGTGELVYKNPQEIYLVEYSQNFGFAYFVIDNDGKSKNWLDIYETQNEVIEILEQQFGKIEKWETLQDDLMKTMEYLMKIR
jgi:hypothetical protein